MNTRTSVWESIPLPQMHGAAEPPSLMLCIPTLRLNPHRHSQLPPVDRHNGRPTESFACFKKMIPYGTVLLIRLINIEHMASLPSAVWSTGVQQSCTQSS